jgi:hypothetical protein
LPSGNSKIKDFNKISAMSFKMAGAGALRHEQIEPSNIQNLKIGICKKSAKTCKDTKITDARRTQNYSVIEQVQNHQKGRWS